MHSALTDRAFGWAIGLASILLVGLTLYTAYFGVFPDGLQRSAHLLLVMALVYVGALRAFVFGGWRCEWQRCAAKDLVPCGSERWHHRHRASHYQF